jgi:hypothetical protein
MSVDGVHPTVLAAEEIGAAVRAYLLGGR